MLLTDKLQTPIFSATEQTVIDYLLTERQLIADLTTKEIAKASFTSPSLLIRISHKMGYSGWLSFKKDLLKEMAYLDNRFKNIDANFPFSSRDNNLTISNKIGTLIQETITDSLELISPDLLEKAIDLISQSQQIKIFTSSINSYLAKDFAFKMNRINKPTTIISFEGDHFVEAANLRPGDLVFIISYSGENNGLTALLPLIKNKQNNILTLTNMGENTISQAADCPLMISTREKLYSKIGGFSSHYSICFILDCLYSCTFATNYEKNYQRSHRISRHSDPRFSNTDTLRED